MKTSWNRIANLPTSWKNENQARKKRQRTEWKKAGELKGIRTIDKKYVRKG